MNAPDAAFAATKAAMIVDVWVDLFATSLARSGALGNGLPVVLTDALRVLPLLESQGPIGWIHTSPRHYQDHVLIAHGQPSTIARPRSVAVQAPRAAATMDAPPTGEAPTVTSPKGTTSDAS